MSKSLMELWGLTGPRPSEVTSTDQYKQFRQAFVEKIVAISESLKQTAPYGSSSQQASLDAQRKALYAAYQKVAGQMNTGSPLTAETDRVLAAAEALREKSHTYMQDVESARQQWSEREGELQQAIEKVLEMQENDHQNAGKFREVIEKIQSHAYDGNYAESTRAVDQLLPKLDPIYSEFRGKLGEGPVTGYSGDAATYNNEPVMYEAGPTGNEYSQLHSQNSGGLSLGEYSGENAPGGEYGSDVIDHTSQYADMGYVENTNWWSGLSGKSGEGLEGASNVAGDLWDSAKEKASKSWDDASDAASDAKKWVKDKASDAADWTSDTVDDVKSIATGGESRPLTEDEIAYAKEVFGENIDYSKIRVVKGSAGSLGNTPRTIGDSVHMTDGKFEAGTMKLTKKGLETLIHEMTHVHQYQKNGWEYAPEALWEQAKSYVLEGDRGHAYEWERAEQEGLDPAEWNPEQQGSVIEEYNKLLRAKQQFESEGKALNQEGLDKLERMKKHVDKILNAPPEKDIIDKGAEAVDDAWNWTKDTAEEAWDGAGDAWDSVEDKASELWNDATETVENVWDSATEEVEKKWDSATEKAGEMWDSVQEKASNVWDTASDKASEVWNDATDSAGETWNDVKNTANNAYDSASNAVSDAASSAQETASEAYDTVTEAASNAYDNAANAASNAVDTVSDAASDAYNDASNAAGKAWDSLFG